MDQDNCNKISIVESFAFFVRNIWILLIGALIGMILLLLCHIISSNSTKKVETYNESLSKYKEEVSSLESILDNLNLKLEFYNEVESISPVFSNNEIYVSKVMIAFHSSMVADSEKRNDVISQEIITFWESLALPSVFGSDLDNDVLKASTVFECAGQSVFIKVFSEDSNKAEKYAESIVGAYVNFFETRDDFSIASKTITTSAASKNEIALTRDKLLSEKAILRKAIAESESALKALKKETPSKYHILKNAVIGFLVGGFIVASVLVMGFVVRGPIVCSFNAEKMLGIPFLGALYIDNRFVSKLARRIIGEREFKNSNQAFDYLKSSFSSKSFNSLDNKKSITLISSLDESDIEKKAQEIKAILKSEGYELTYIAGFSENPHAIKALEESDAVFFLERQWISRMQLLCMNKNLVSAINKKVLGFIIC